MGLFDLFKKGKKDEEVKQKYLILTMLLVL